MANYSFYMVCKAGSIGDGQRVPHSGTAASLRMNGAGCGLILPRESTSTGRPSSSSTYSLKAIKLKPSLPGVFRHSRVQRLTTIKYDVII